MIIKFWTKKALQAWDRRNHIDIGEPAEAGWYYQPARGDAPIGPYATELGAQLAASAELASCH